MSGVALYSLTTQYRQLLDTLSEGDFDAVTVADTIEASGLTDDIAAKASGIEMVARSLTAHCPAIDAEIIRLTALKRQRENAAAGLRAYLLHNMQASGITKLESPLFKISVRDNPSKLDVFEPDLVPEKFWIQPALPPKAIDNAALKAALKVDDNIPGARLTTGQRLAIA